MEINVLDVGDPFMRRVAMVLQTQLGKKDLIELAPGPRGVERMIDEIGKRADAGTIDIFRLYAHGNTGIINVAHGHERGEDEDSALTLSTVQRLKPLLATLTPYFSSTARVELHGCMVALGTDGERLMLELARLWRVRVQASPDPEPMGAVQFQGRVYEARPGGLSCVPPTDITKN